MTFRVMRFNILVELSKFLFFFLGLFRFIFFIRFLFLSNFVTSSFDSRIPSQSKPASHVCPASASFWPLKGSRGVRILVIVYKFSSPGVKVTQRS